MTDKPSLTKLLTHCELEDGTLAFFKLDIVILNRVQFLQLSITVVSKQDIVKKIDV